MISYLRAWRLHACSHGEARKSLLHPTGVYIADFITGFVHPCVLFQQPHLTSFGYLVSLWLSRGKKQSEKNAVNQVQSLFYKVFHGSSAHGAHIWSKIRYFNLLKAFSYIERVVKSNFYFSANIYFTSYVLSMFWVTILNKYHGAYSLYTKRKA